MSLTQTGWLSVGARRRVATWSGVGFSVRSSTSFRLSSAV